MGWAVGVGGGVAVGVAVGLGGGVSVAVGVGDGRDVAVGAGAGVSVAEGAGELSVGSETAVSFDEVHAMTATDNSVTTRKPCGFSI